MFRNAYQKGVFTVFYSCGAKPLAIWDTCTRDGYIDRFLDPEIKTMVFEIGGTNISTTYMICPKGNEVLGIKMPFLVMVVKNLKKYFSFEVTALDESNIRRRFRISNFQSTTQIMPQCTAMPINLADGWNRIQFNMAEFMQRAYHKQYIEVHKLKINANVRIRRIYFADELLPEKKLPVEYRLLLPHSSKKLTIKDESQGKENMDPTIPKQVQETNAVYDELAALSKTWILIPSPSLTNVRVKDSGYIPTINANDDISQKTSESSSLEENTAETHKAEMLSTIDENDEKTIDIAGAENPPATSLQVNAATDQEVHGETQHEADLEIATETLTTAKTEDNPENLKVSLENAAEVSTDTAI